MDYQLYVPPHRNSCNDVDLKPIDLFRHIYSYACGDRYTSATIPILEDCDIVDFGTCSFGGLNIIRSDLFPLLPSFNPLLQVFEDLMKSAMVEISLLVTVCLPIELDSCTALIGDVLDEKYLHFQDMIDSYDEVSRNIIATTNCVISGVVPSLATIPSALLPTLASIPSALAPILEPLGIRNLKKSKEDSS